MVWTDLALTLAKANRGWLMLNGEKGQTAPAAEEPLKSRLRTV